MRLPPMLRADSGVTYLHPGTFTKCWIAGCSNTPRAKSDTGLCDECIEQLRVQTNEGGMQCVEH